MPISRLSNLNSIESVNKSGALSAGAIAGIVTGGLLLVGLCVGAVCLFARTHKYQDDVGIEMNYYNRSTRE